MADDLMRKLVHVAVGVIYGADGKILVAQRAATQHLGGLWEFPGGKVEAGESVNTALGRELQEELGITVLRQSALCKISHDYPDKSVLLDVWNVESFAGQPHGREGQPLRWLTPQELRHKDFPEANRAIIRAIQLPDHLALVSADSTLSDMRDICARLPDKTLMRLRHNKQREQNTSSTDTLQQLLSIASDAGRGVIVDITGADDQGWQLLPDVRGVHANRHVLSKLSQRPVPEHLLFGASCHNISELQKATQCGADYVLLSPVQKSRSHPEQDGMGWEKFAQLTQSVDTAIYAMGGLELSDLNQARACGARGIAGIRLFS